MKKALSIKRRDVDVESQDLLVSSTDASISKSNACAVVSVGKRRDGGTRYWCLKHKADATAKYGKPSVSCRTAHFTPIAPEEILTIDIARYSGGVALWGAVPPVYDTTKQSLDRGIHVHARAIPEGSKDIDKTFRAVRIVGQALPKGGLYIDELDAIYYMATTVFGYTMRNVLCSYCQYSHLDRDWFSIHPHRRHLCAGCGKHFRDSETSIGNPICGVRNACGASNRSPKLSKRSLNIRQQDYPGGVQIWGSNPAFIWTRKAAEEEGIHVHAFKEDTLHPDLDETYGKVTIDGITLDPLMVRLFMAQAVLPSLKERISSVSCPKCQKGLLSQGDQAFTPVTTHQCTKCKVEVKSKGRFRKTICNPLPTVLSKLATFSDRSPRKHDLGLLPETI